MEPKALTVQSMSVFISHKFRGQFLIKGCLLISGPSAQELWLAHWDDTRLILKNGLSSVILTWKLHPDSLPAAGKG